MSTTRGALRAKVLLRIGDTSSSQFYTTAFLNDLIDERLLTRSGEFARYSPNYYLEHYQFTGRDDALDSTYEFYAVPANFRAFVKVERRYGTNPASVYSLIWRSLRTINSEDEDRYRFLARTILTLPDSLTVYEQVVSMWDTKLRILPAPIDNTFIYRLKYLRRPVTATDDNDDLDIPDEWVSAIVYDVARFALTQTGDPLMERFDKLYNSEVSIIDKEYRRRSTPTQGIMTLEEM